MHLEMDCDVCGDHRLVDVARMPGVPTSLAYCRPCAEANAHPWVILVVDTALSGGLGHATAAWRNMVMDTCRHLGRPFERFLLDVETEMRSQRDFGREALKS